MQTFLPYANPRASAAALDDLRLGKQRVETFQVLRALTWAQYGWRNHPVVRMWRGFVPALVAYGLACVDEWRARGRADATAASLLEFTGGLAPDWDELHDRGEVPPWIGDEALHLSHQSSLLRKDPGHYRPLFGDVPDDLPYVWPDPAFPRWPIRRGAGEPLDTADAAALVGLDTVPDEVADVVARLRDGHDAEAPPDGIVPPRLLGLLAGLATPGTTLWLVDLPPLKRAGAAPPARTGTGSVSASTARPPTDADRASVEAEARAVPEFRFTRRGLATRALADQVGAGLVVTPVPGEGRELGRPRLVLPEAAAAKPR